MRARQLALTGGTLAFVLGVASCTATHAARRTSNDASCSTPSEYRIDLDALWSAVRDHYAYLTDKAVDWQRARLIYEKQADTVSSRRSSVGLFERLLDELYDAHATMRANTSHSFRIVPTGADLWAEWRKGKAVVTSVRPGFAAEESGIRPGMAVLAVNGVAIEEATSARVGAALTRTTDEARQWALQSVVAGRHDVPRTLRVADSDGRALDVIVDVPGRHEVDANENLPVVQWRLINGSVGYVRLNALGDERSVPAFDSALVSLRESRGLILDLRNAPSGGNTSVAEPIMGRLISRQEGYQRVIPRDSAAYVRRVSPRGPWTYTKPVVVLVSRWTGSMGEGITIGLDGMRRATVVGTRMAGLAGAVDDITLPCSRLRAGLPTARLAHLDGTPREKWSPPVLVDLITASPTVRDPILERGLATLTVR